MSETMRRPLPRFQWMCSCGTVVSMNHSSCYVCQRPRKMETHPDAEASLGNAIARRAAPDKSG
jgi:hypothetical protein